MKSFTHFFLLTILFLSSFLFNLTAQTLYINSSSGNDTNPGTIDKPFKSFSPIEQIVNSLEGEGTTIVKIEPGIYHLDEKVLFKNYRKYTEAERLVIEAAALPGDTAWTHADMPIIISTAVPSDNFGFKCSIGLDIEVNHVTIRGLKFLGNPQTEIYYYPIGRQGKDLEDLVITQCMFIGDEDALPIQSGILAHGNKIIIDHSVFYNCKNSVVFYFADDNREVQRYGSEMKYCIVNGAYECGIWTASPDTDFKFHHNIITRSKNMWIHNLLNTTVYSIDDCIITNNENYITKLGQNYEYLKSDITFRENNVIRNGDIILVKKNDISIPENYLHVVPNTLGSKLGAGLFYQ
ncbi:hypothetical protein ACFLTH_13825 [Bacteroidota bacterium]